MEMSDRIKQQIQQLRAALGRLLGLKDDRKEEEAKKLLSETYQDYFQNDFTKVSKLNYEQYIASIEFRKDNLEPLESLIELLKFDAFDLTESLVEKEAKLLFLKKVVEKVNELDNRNYSLSRNELLKITEEELANLIGN